jgi:hypothetical protein
MSKQDSHISIQLTLNIIQRHVYVHERVHGIMNKKETIGNYLLT